MNIKNRQYKEVCEWGVKALKNAGITEAEPDARLLLEHVCQTDRNTLYAHADLIVSEEQSALYAELISRRCSRLPLQRILGTQVFMGLTFLVNEHVLIPRQDTECLVEEALKAIKDKDRVLDLCTGSGCILLSIMSFRNDIAGIGTDISEEALEVARKNAENLGQPAIFIKSDLFGQLRMPPESLQAENSEPAAGPFDVIVSNPPYIRSDVIPTLEPEVKDYEPRSALDGGADGLVFYRRIAREAPDHLKSGGKVFLEIGYDQGAAVKALMEEAGFCEVEVVKDLAGMDRIVRCTYR